MEEDNQPRILFGRTSLAITAIAAGMVNMPVLKVRFPAALTGIDTLVSSYNDGDDIDFGAFEYCEILAVSPVSVCATPVEVTYDDDDEDEEDGEENENYYDEYDASLYTESRPSAAMEHALSIIGIPELPSFGRRLLLVSYEHELVEREMQRIKERVRKRLTPCVTVWQGRSFEGYCFVDSRTPDHIMSPLQRILDCDEIDDYLLVQPTRMVLEDKSGLSPLGDWMYSGWKKTNIRDPRSARSGRID